MSLVLPLPHPPRSPHPYHPLSRPTTPSAPPSLPHHQSQPAPRTSSLSSRPSTPTPMALPPPSHLHLAQPISAPPTPVTPTHLPMERCRSSEAALGSHHELAQPEPEHRGGRARDVKATSLLFGKGGVTSEGDVVNLEARGKGEWEHLEKQDHVDGEDDEKMDVDQVGSSSSGALATAEGDKEEMNVDLGTAAAGALNVETMEQESAQEEEESREAVWGMPKWGWEEERKEVRKGVRLVGMEELPALIDQHSMLDIPSHVLFPWLHGISDDGAKGRDMAAFFGHGPPFEPPPYRGLCVLRAPPHPLDDTPPSPPPPTRTTTSVMPVDVQSDARERSSTMSTSSESYRSSQGTANTASTDGTSPSVADFQPSPTYTGKQLMTPPMEYSPKATQEEEGEEGETDVQMHPCESKRVSPQARAEGLAEPQHPLPCEQPSDAMPRTETSSSSTSSEEDMEDDASSDSSRPTCLLLNALHATDIFDLPKPVPANSRHPPTPPQACRFRQARLPHQINLRNLNIQQIKYATISDIVLYAKGGVGAGVLEIASKIAEAQEQCWRERMEGFYRATGRVGMGGEGVGEPVRYGCWVVVEPFYKIQKFAPHLVNLDAAGLPTHNSVLTDLFEREAHESREMTRGSEVVEGFWVGNDCDVPGGADDGAGAKVAFDLCVRASECSDMPSPASLSSAGRKLADLEKRRYGATTTRGRRQSAKEEDSGESGWSASPATVALRNLLSPTRESSRLPPDSPEGLRNKRNAPPGSPAEETPSRRPRRTRSSLPAPPASDLLLPPSSTTTTEGEYVTLECAGSCRTITGQMRNLQAMTDRVVELVYFLRKVVEGKDTAKGIKKKVLVHCQDGYTESSIIVLAFIMSSLSVSLPEAFLHLQITAQRSFFLYPSDRPLLRRVDARLAADRREKAMKLLSSTPAGPPLTSSSSNHQALTPPASPTVSRWKTWGFGRASSPFSASSPAQDSAAAEEQPQQPTRAATIDSARQLLSSEERGGSQTAQEARAWFEDKRFDGFPSRILPFLYLGNLAHAGNVGMLRALGIGYVVSVGESLLSGQLGEEEAGGLREEVRAGRVQVLDLTDVRDDGNDPLRPLIARACAWIEQARLAGGTVLVHCRVGVSRSASIVMAYMMQHLHMGLMDAYLTTRARRLNVLIQPNLRFFHELFGWEVELARQEAAEAQRRRDDAKARGVTNEDELRAAEGGFGKRTVLYSWPSFCRDLHCLNRRFLCN